MADLDLDQIAARVADRIGTTADDPDTVAAVAAADAFVRRTCSIDTLPDEPDVAQGMVGFSRALYLDAFASRGANVVLGDTTVDTVFNPEDPWRHWHHFFDGLTTRWGIA